MCGVKRKPGTFKVRAKEEEAVKDSRNVLRGAAGLGGQSGVGGGRQGAGEREREMPA